MALMYLVDTNIFLEILLAQDRNVDCKEFLQTHSAEIALSDFTLH
jgi:predicted nucleic acid-binding protein